MTDSRKIEASLAGEASQVENNNEFRNKDTSPTNFFIADSGSKSNAYLIFPQEKFQQDLLFSLRNYLKKLGCRYNQAPLNKGWICPIAKLESVKVFLKDIKVVFKEIYHEYYEKSNEGQLADDEWVTIDRLEKKFQEADSAIRVARYKFEMKDPSSEISEAVEDLAKREAAQARLQEEIHQRRAAAGILDKSESAVEEDALPRGFVFRKGQLIFEPDSLGADEPPPPIVVTFQELRVKARLSDQSGDNHGLLLSFVDVDGKQKEYPMPMALLARDGAEYREVLLRKGLGIASGKAR